MTFEVIAACPVWRCGFQSRHRGNPAGRRPSVKLIRCSFHQEALRSRIQSRVCGSPLATEPLRFRQAENIMLDQAERLIVISTHTKVPLGTIKTRLRSSLQTMKKRLTSRGLSGPAQWPIAALTRGDILITYQLASRPCRRRSSRQEADSLRSLAQVAANSPAQLLNTFLKFPIDLCSAGTAGLRMLETNPEGIRFFDGRILREGLKNTPAVPPREASAPEELRSPAIRPSSSHTPAVTFTI